MPESTTILIPLLTWAAAPAGAGWLASRLFDLLRRWFPLPTSRPRRRIVRVALGLLHRPRWARPAVLALSAAIGVAAAAVIALFAGQDVAHAADVALAGALAAISSQVRHGMQLPPLAPEEAARV